MASPAGTQVTPAPPPPGVISRKVQMWLVIGLSVVVMAIVMYGSSRTEAEAAKAATLAKKEMEVTVQDVGDLLAEQQRLQKKAQRTPPLPGPEGPEVPSRESERAAADAAARAQAAAARQVGGGGGGGPLSPEEEDRRVRLYKSLYSSQIAQSFRGTTAAGPRRPGGDSPPSSRRPSGEGLPPGAEDAIKRLALQALGAGGAPGASGAPALPPGFPPGLVAGAAAQAPARNTTALNRSVGRGRVLFEGTVLEAALLTRLDGEFAGPVVAMTTLDTWSRDRLQVLIPAGTRLLGTAQKVGDAFQGRLAVAFHRAIMPDGYSLDLDQFVGLNISGDAGLKDQVDRHYTRTFGASLALGLLGGVASLSQSVSGTSSFDGFRSGVGTSMAQAGTTVLDRFLNALPTVTIREGHRIKVYIAGDLTLPEYRQHRMDPNL